MGRRREKINNKKYDLSHEKVITNYYHLVALSTIRRFYNVNVCLWQTK